MMSVSAWSQRIPARRKISVVKLSSALIKTTLGLFIQRLKEQYPAVAQVFSGIYLRLTAAGKLPEACDYQAGQWKILKNILHRRGGPQYFRTGLTAYTPHNDKAERGFWEMKAPHYEKQVLDHRISVDIHQIGEDWLAEISGGCRPHIGSVSVGTFAKGEVTLEKILLPEHRDDVIGDLFAAELAKRLQSTVTAVCGIHYENPGPEGIRQIVACAKDLLQEIIAEISK